MHRLVDPRADLRCVPVLRTRGAFPPLAGRFTRVMVRRPRDSFLSRNVAARRR